MLFVAFCENSTFTFILARMGKKYQENVMGADALFRSLTAASVRGHCQD